MMIYERAPNVLLDEATANVDYATGALIQSRFCNALCFAGAKIIVVADHIDIATVLSL